MFQVAQHPTTFSHHGSMASPNSAYSGAPSSQAAVQLPRNLARPPYRELARDAIAAVSPELAGVPAEYIRSGLVEQASRMLSGNACLLLPSNISRSRLPSSITVGLRPPTSSVAPLSPTHVLAISQSKSHSDHVALFPVHGVVFASHCANLPRLPPSNAQTSSSSMHLPLLALSVPSAAAFALIHSFLYTHSIGSLLASLLPLPKEFTHGLSAEAAQHTMQSRSKMQKLSHALCSASGRNPQALMAHAAHVKELWQDVVHLGVHSPELWLAIDLAWEIVLGAFNVASQH